MNLDSAARKKKAPSRETAPSGFGAAWGRRRHRLVHSVMQWYAEMRDGWDRFWFRAEHPHVLGVIRILIGLMLVYNHLIWATQLPEFLGATAWIPANVSQAMAGDSYLWTPLWNITSPMALWSVHLASLVVFGLYTVGWQTRRVAPLAWALTVIYCHRLQGALFGFDQVLAMATMYLMIGRCGDAYSVDAKLARKSSKSAGATDAGEGQGGACVANNLAIRLLQVHLCIIYLFGGLAKVRGTSWWDGSAMWNAIANLEYQSLDITFLGRAPWLLAMLSLVVVFWETFYCALIWPRWSRPLVLALAVATHAGIGLALGMITFGLAMITVNLSFVPSSLLVGADRSR